MSVCQETPNLILSIPRPFVHPLLLLIKILPLFSNEAKAATPGLFVIRMVAEPFTLSLTRVI